MTNMQCADHNTSSETDKQCKGRYWNSQLIAKQAINSKSDVHPTEHTAIHREEVFYFDNWVSRGPL